MPDEDEQPEALSNEFDRAARVNFRDYPSTALVVVAALSSGLGWMLYRWLGRKREAGHAGPEGLAGVKGPAEQKNSAADRDN